jgi:hypothetical protein
MVSEIKRLERKIERAAKTCIRLLAVCVIVVGGVVYFTFGTLSPCGILHEGIRQRDDFVAILPDDIVEFGLEVQFREMSNNRCFAILLNELIPAVPFSKQTSLQSASSLVPQEFKNGRAPKKLSDPRPNNFVVDKVF